MLHRYRTVMVRPGRERLSGNVEVDESFLGGPALGIPGRGVLGKVLFAGAVELDDRGFGRARLGVLENANADSLRTFLVDNVEPGSRIITDGWSAYPRATRDLYTHKGTSIAASGLDAHEVLPAVYRVFALVKRWVMGTMQGSVSPEHVQAYFDEWVFRFNRRHSRSRGLLFHRADAAGRAGDAITYKELRKAGRTRPAPAPLTGPRSLPPSVWTSATSSSPGGGLAPDQARIYGTEMEAPTYAYTGCGPDVHIRHPTGVPSPQPRAEGLHPLSGSSPRQT